MQIVDILQTKHLKQNLSPVGAYFSACNVCNNVKLDIHTLIAFPLMHTLRENAW